MILIHNPAHSRVGGGGGDINHNHGLLIFESFGASLRLDERSAVASAALA